MEPSVSYMTSSEKQHTKFAVNGTRSKRKTSGEISL